MKVLQVVHLNLIQFDKWERYKTCCLRCEPDCLLLIQNPIQVNRLFAMQNIMFYISLGQVKTIWTLQTLFWTENMLNQQISNLILNWKHAQSKYFNKLNPPPYSINYILLFFASYTSSLHFVNNIQILYIIYRQIYAVKINTVNLNRYPNQQHAKVL